MCISFVYVYKKRRSIMCTNLQKKLMPMMISGLVVEDVEKGNSGFD